MAFTPGVRSLVVRPAGDRLRPTGVHLKIIEDESGFDGVADDWRRLHETTASPNLFTTPLWIQTWWRHFHQGARPRIFVYYDEQGPRALFPLKLDRKRFDGFRANVLGFMTNEESTKPQWIVRGDPGPVLRQWAADLAATTDWDVLDLAPLPEDTPGLDLLPEILDAHKLRWLRRLSEGALCLDVTGGFDDYWRGRSRNLKKGVRNRENRLAARGGFKLEISRTQDDPQWWLDRIFNVAAHTWKAAQGTSLADGERRRFFTDVVEALWPGGRVRVFMVSLGGVDIAYDLTFIHRGFLYDFKIDYHQDFRELAPGVVLLKHLVAHGCADPEVHTIDFITDPIWMRRWTTDLVQNHRLIVFNQTLTGRTLSLLEKNLRPVARVVKRLVKRGRPESPARASESVSRE
jgi:CelD/BcsL family acetyltransferase involved in cellulose biosynthesis